jgi:hypothetical protein
VEKIMEIYIAGIMEIYIAGIMLLALLTWTLYLYGVYHSFKASVGWGIVSIFLSPLALVVGSIKLFSNKNILIGGKK